MENELILNAEIEQDLEYMPDYSSIASGVINLTTKTFTFKNKQEKNYLDEENLNKLIYEYGKTGEITYNLFIYKDNKTILECKLDLELTDLEKQEISLKGNQKIEELYSKVLYENLNSKIDNKHQSVKIKL